MLTEQTQVDNVRMHAAAISGTLSAMTQDIGPIEAEWMDPAVKLPPDGWTGLASWSENENTEEIEGHDSAMFANGEWYRSNLITLDNYGPDAWLRINGPSDSIPREKVQLAVDVLENIAAHLEEDGKNEAAISIRYVISIMSQHTGVKPTERNSHELL